MTIKKVNGTGRNDVLRGGNGSDWIDGGNGDDQLYGNGGIDALFGGRGRDTLDGGAGSDYLDAGECDDLLVYAMGENKGSYDVYNGWTGSDTLRLVFTAAEWDREDVRQDVHRFLAYLPEYNEPLGWIDDPLFSFRSFGLSVVGVNKLEVVVDGKTINAADRTVTVADDALTLSEDDASSALVNLLANDQAADGVRSVKIAQPANGTVELVRTDFAAAQPVAEVRFTPKTGAFDHLKAGETAKEVFTYTVTDKDGDVKTGTVTVTVTGTNDAPVAVADKAIFIDGSGGVLSGSVAANDKDADAGGELYFDYDYWSAPRGFRMNAGGSWTYDQSSDGLPGAMKAGESVVYEIPYTVTDAAGARSTATLTLTVLGVNDAPDVYYMDVDVEEDADQPAEDGVLTRYLSLDYRDRDSDDVEVTVLGGPDDAWGTLEFAGTWEGTVTFEYRLDAARVAALEEGQVIEQVYRVRLDDGDGGVVDMDVPVRIVGDGEDPTIYLFSRDTEFKGNEGVHRWESDFYFEDKDEEEEITFEVRAVGHDLGEVSVVSEQVGDGRRIAYVTFSYTDAELDALPDDRTELSYQIVAIDSKGVETIHDYVIQPRIDEYYVGGDGNDDMSVYGFAKGVGIGGGGDDRLVGGQGRQWLYGDEGPGIPAHEEPETFHWEWSDPVAGFNDELDGGSGADTLHGGGGADRFILRAGEADGDTILDFDPTSGDRIELHEYGADATITSLGENRWEIASADGKYRDVVMLADGAELGGDTVVFLNRPTVWTVGTEGDERLFGSFDNPNVLVGGGGSDQLIGREFADRLYGDAGPTPPNGAEVGMVDWFWGNWGYDDDLDGGAGDDVLDGGTGADQLIGGMGADLFVFRAGEANGDFVADYDRADGDRMEFIGYGGGATATLLDDGSWQVASADGTIVDVISFGWNVTVTADDFVFV